MSAPTSRGQRGGSTTRGGRAAPFSATKPRDSARGTPPPTSAGRGRGRGGTTLNTTAAGGDGLLQQLRAGTLKRGSDNGTTTPGRGQGTPAIRGPSTPNTRARGRGRGRASQSQSFNYPRSQSSAPPSRTSSPVPSNQRDFYTAALAKFQVLKQQREQERAKAIRDGFLADPEKKTSLDNAITPVGTCTDMCPAFERVERIVQNMVDKAEKVHHDDTGKDIPAEDRMVKRFRRSAAGYDEQLPSDIRTPETLKRTLDYLLDNVIGGGERLATVHKYVWDRTRGIRNDFSIQQVTKREDVQIAVECYERIARFHILSLHQLSNPDNLWDDENFDAHQEREQLNNTLLSLLYYYDDNNQRMDFPNESEFRAYCIIFELQSQHPDLEDRMQSWGIKLLADRKVKTALKLYAAAGNSLFDQGPLRPMEPFAIAQGKTGSFWSALDSRQVSYVMACVAEIYFGHVRFTALEALWNSVKSAPTAQQARSRDWSLDEVTAYLGFDSEEETKEFCSAFELDFSTDDQGDEYLDPTVLADHHLDQSSIPTRQWFSHNYVEKKRCRRTLTAVINGAAVGEAIREGWTDSDETVHSDQEESRDDDQSMFVPESKPFGASTNSPRFGTSLNPTASAFTPRFGESAASEKPAETSASVPFGSGQFGTSGPFGSTTPVSNPSPFGQPAPPFGQPTSTPQTASTIPFGQPPTQQATNPSPFGQSMITQPPVKHSPFGLPSSSDDKPASTGFNFQGSKFPQTTDAPKASEAISTTAAKIPPFTGFNFGKPSSAMTASGESTATASTAPKAPSAPSIFNQPQNSNPPFSASTSQPSTASSTISTPSTPFQLGSYSVTSAQSAELSKEPPPLENNSKSQPFKFSSIPSTPKQLETQSSSKPSNLGFSFKPTTSSPLTAPSSTLNQGQSSTRPEATPKPPSEGFKFPQNQLIETSSGGPAKSAPFETQKQPLSAHSFKPRVPPPPQRSTTRQSSPPRQPPEQGLTQKDRDKLVENLSRVALLRPSGLIQNYIEWTLPDIVRSVINQHHREVYSAAIASVRRRIVMRKFANIWRSLTWNNILSRKAKNRRQQFSETVKAEAARKKKTEEELNAILAAAAESRRMQKEIEEAAEAQEMKERVAAEKRTPSYNANSGVIKVAGRKRKSISEPEGPSDDPYANGVPYTPGHKRSRTMGISSEPSTAVIGDGCPHPIYTSVFKRRSVLGRSTSSQDLRQSTMASKKLDTTQTDYFRLKALGINADETPLVPYTDKQLAEKRQRDAARRKRVIDETMKRTSTLRYDPSPSPDPDSSKAPEITNTPPPAHKESPKATAPAAPFEDDFLKEIRKAREAMADTTEWFKEQRKVMEKQTEQEEEFRRSQESDQRSVGTPANVIRSANGLARANGYEYLPAETKPSVPLSRTEQRIRATGAHGLAYKPLRKSSNPDYIPVAVAMSKRSASMYSPGVNLASQQVQSSPARKRSIDEVDTALQNHSESPTTNNIHASKRSRTTPEKPTSAPDRYTVHTPILKKNPFELLQSIPNDEGDDLEDREDQEGGPEVHNLAQYEEGVNGQFQRYYGVSHHDDDSDEEDLEEEEEQTEEDLEEELEEEELEEEEEEELEAEEEEEEELEEDGEEEEEDNDEELYNDEDGSRAVDPNYLHASNEEGYYDDEAATPMTNTQMSRDASSAPGASADDAFVLSDDSD